MNEEIIALINKMIARIDTLLPSIDDSEEVLLISKTLQELVSIEVEGGTLEELKKAIHDLEVLINGVDSSLKVLITANDSDIASLTSTLNSHLNNFNNPNKVTKAQVGLGSVDNYDSTSDVEDSSTNKFSTAKAVNVVWNKAKNALLDAPEDGKNYIRKNGEWIEAETVIRIDSVPIGVIMPFYGKVAPDGYLICDGREVSITDYPELVAHLSGLREAKFKTTEPISYSGGNWEKGLVETEDIKGITWANTNDNGSLNNLSLLKKVITPSGNNELVAVIEEYEDNGSTDNSTGIRYSIANSRYALEMIHGDWETFKKEASGKTIDIYNSISDIELKNAVYLPDSRGMFLRGYDSRVSRELMSNESDAIRNIYSETDIFCAPHGDTSTAPSPFFQVRRAHTNVGGTGWFTYDIGFDASRVVPTSTENRPVNLNPLFIIKSNYV